jgi:hypothetical protein
VVSTIFYVTDFLEVLKSFLLLIGFKEKYDLGGVVGAVIGVSDMEKFTSKSILGLDTILYDFTSTENNENFRKVGLFKRATGKGAFNKLLGNVTIEVQNLSRKSSKIYAERYWGDCGFIHLCFDQIRWMI